MLFCCILQLLFKDPDDFDREMVHCNQVSVIVPNYHLAKTGATSNPSRSPEMVLDSSNIPYRPPHALVRDTVPGKRKFPTPFNNEEEDHIEPVPKRTKHERMNTPIKRKIEDIRTTPKNTITKNIKEHCLVDSDKEKTHPPLKRMEGDRIEKTSLKRAKTLGEVLTPEEIPKTKDAGTAIPCHSSNENNRFCKSLQPPILPTLPVIQVVIVNHIVNNQTPNNKKLLLGKFCPIAPAPKSKSESATAERYSKGSGRRRNHVCHYRDCGKTYIKSSHLKAHLRTHTGYYRYIHLSYC